MLGHFQFNWLWALCTERAFSSIQFTHERKYIHGYRYDLNGMEATLDGSQCLDHMYDQTLGWSYVISPGMQRFDKQCWRKDLECRHVRKFRVVSVPDIHETSRFRHRSFYQDPNHMTVSVKSRNTTPTASEDDEESKTTEDEKTSAVITTTEYSRRTWQWSMLVNGKSLPVVYSYSDWVVFRSKVHIRFGEMNIWILYWNNWALSEDP